LELSELLCDARLNSQDNRNVFQGIFSVFSTNRELLEELWDAKRNTISI
jgi:hypothetical protein